MIRSFSWERGARLPGGKTEQIVAEPPAGGWVWVDVIDEGHGTITSVCEGFGIPQAWVEDVLTPGSLPMIAEQRDLVYVVLNAFRTSSGGRLGTTEVDIFIGPDFLLTVHDGDVASTAIVVERLGQGHELAVASPMGLFAHIAMVGNRRVPALIDRLGAQLDDLEELAMTADPRAITEVHALRRDLVVMRRVLVPQRQIYEELADGMHPLLDDASRTAFERVSSNQAQILESLDGARSLLGSVLETHRGAVAEQTNEIVRLLTVFAAILLPLSLVAGIFGMNFLVIPLSDHPRGFWFVVAAMAVGAIGLWVYFARRGFVGGPRLRDLPRAMGLGLYTIGVAPIKVVAEGIETTIRYVAGEDEEPEQP
jgi:magnesium transporter